MPDKTPHDDLFKAVFSITSEVIAFSQLYLPEFISKNLNYKTLKIELTSYVGENLKQYFSDIVYSVDWKNGKRLKLSFLLEHKSYVPRNIYLQLHRYLTEIYNHQDAENKKLQLVIPIVIYHGKDGWKKRDFSDYFDLPDENLQRYVPNLFYELIDLNKISDDLIINHSVGHYLQSTFLVFKHTKDKSFIEEFSQEIFIFVEKELDEIQKTFYLRSLLKYIFETFNYKKQEFKDFTENLNDMTQRVTGNLYDQLVEEGMVIGMEKGIEIESFIKNLEDKSDLLSKMVEANFSNEVIISLSGLSVTFVKEFKSNFTEKKVNELKKAYRDARKLNDLDAIRIVLIQAMHRFGFSKTFLATYFEKSVREISKITTLKN